MTHTFLPASEEDLIHARTWAERHVAELLRRGRDLGRGRSEAEATAAHSLGHLGELLLARDLEAQHYCEPEAILDREQNGYDLLVAGRRIEVKTSRLPQLWEHTKFSRAHFDHVVLLADRRPHGLEVMGFTDPDDFANRAELGRNGGPRWMPWQALGRYEVLVDILFDPELAGAAALNDRPFGG